MRSGAADAAAATTRTTCYSRRSRFGRRPTAARCSALLPTGPDDVTIGERDSGIKNFPNTVLFLIFSTRMHKLRHYYVHY